MRHVSVYNQYMSERLSKLKSFSNHEWLSKAYRRLSPGELEIMASFIADNDHLDKGRFELAVNRMFLDKPKPKNFTIILELLTCCNSSLRR